MEQARAAAVAPCAEFPLSAKPAPVHAGPNAEVQCYPDLNPDACTGFAGCGDSPAGGDTTGGIDATVTDCSTGWCVPGGDLSNGIVADSTFIPGPDPIFI